MEPRSGSSPGEVREDDDEDKDEKKMLIWRQCNADEAAISWDTEVSNLRGFNPYQTYRWGLHKKTMGLEIVRFLGEEEGQVKSALQASLRRLPGNGGVLWAHGGPLGEESHWDDSLRNHLKSALDLRYLFLRLAPLCPRNSRHVASLRKQGWKLPFVAMKTGLSLEFNLLEEEMDLKTTADAKWRQNLRRGKKKCQIERYRNPDINEVIDAFRDMERVKGLGVQYSDEEIKSLFQSLSEDLVVFVAKDEKNQIIAIRGFLLSNDAGWDLFAVNTGEGRRRCSSYALLDATIDYCRRLGLKRYDLGGIAPRTGTGVYYFKKGTGAHHTEYLGEWEWCSSELLRWLVNFTVLLKFRGCGEG